MKQKDPEIIFDSSRFHSKEDWIEAGKLVFESATRFLPARALTADDIPYPASTISQDGVLPPNFIIAAAILRRYKAAF